MKFFDYERDEDTDDYADTDIIVELAVVAIVLVILAVIFFGIPLIFGG
ncbi:hypothetical protein FACS18949_04430 [Clostridia bacterium]|nr:hypothetical protein FACS189425_06470 [Clostridia bacterium]GHV32698.1 hypothetical protein FACS18949_04430 [Clostridia bacterium]